VRPPRFTGRFLPVSLLGGWLLLTLAHGMTLEEVAAQPQRWPAEVKITAAAKATVLRDGQPGGVMLLGAGKTIAVTQISPEGITGRTGGALVRVPVEKTDLQARVAAMAPAEPPAAEPEPAPPVPAVLEPVASPAVPAANKAPTKMQRLLVGRLAQLQGGGLKSYDVRRLGGVKYYGIMFSAGWCGPCRQFAPMLLDAYRKLKASYPEFELVLVSWDHSADDMLAYMREENMPWPAMKFGEVDGVEEIARLSGPGIPCLVLVNADGRVLAHSFKGDEYLGPGSVLNATFSILEKYRRAGSPQ
jgi:thiol-disulfide isomerase/thioredoxin